MNISGILKEKGIFNEVIKGVLIPSAYAGKNNVNRIEEATLPKALIGARPQNATVGLAASSKASIAGGSKNVKAKYSLKTGGRIRKRPIRN